MEVIRVTSEPMESTITTVLAIGKFDGVHIGHQAILNTAKQHAGINGHVAVMSFYPHPVYVLTGNANYKRVLTPPNDLVDCLALQGIHRLYEIEFNDAYAAIEPEDFVSRHLARLNLSRVVVGEDFRFGRGGTGDVHLLSDLCAEAGIPVTIVKFVEENGLKVSSSQIRKHLDAGRVEAAEALLGRPYAISGTVIHGDKLGRTLGFPTANLLDTGDYVLPKTGVYAISVDIEPNSVGGGKNWFGVGNLGVRPTVDGVSLRIEAHLLGFHGDLYDRQIRISFLRRIRDERKFKGLDELKQQIHKDCDLAKEMLGIHDDFPSEADL